jgi:hypothetical protein
VRYLSLDIFEHDIDDEDMEAKLVSGAYGLFNYAATQWLRLLIKSISVLRDDQRLSQLADAAAHFVDQRANPAVQCSEKQIQGIPGFEMLQNSHPSLYDTLIHFHSFRKLDNGTWRLDEGN